MFMKGFVLFRAKGFRPQLLCLCTSFSLLIGNNIAVEKCVGRSYSLGVARVWLRVAAHLVQANGNVEGKKLHSRTRLEQNMSIDKESSTFQMRKF